MGGGILPIARHNGEIYLLFSRERIIYNSDKDRGLWSDFGGAKEGNETQYQTAVREGFEESSGLLGDKKHIRYLIKNHLAGKVRDKKYCIWLVEVEYNPNIINDFHKHFQYVLKTNPNIVKKNNGLYEKDKIKWIKLSALKRHKKQFRPWYFKEYMPKIIDLFKH